MTDSSRRADVIAEIALTVREPSSREILRALLRAYDMGYKHGKGDQREARAQGKGEGNESHG